MALSLAGRISAQLRNYFTFFPLYEAGFIQIEDGRLNDFGFAGRFIYVATSAIVISFNGLSLSLKVCRRHATVDRALFFGRRARYATWDPYQIYRRQVFSLASHFKDVVPYFICGIQIYACKVCFSARFLGFTMLIDRISRFNQACRHGINEVRRGSNPFTLSVFTACYLRAAVLGDLGFRFKCL